MQALAPQERQVKQALSKAPQGLQDVDSARVLALLARARLPVRAPWPDTKQCNAAPMVLEAARTMVLAHRPTSLTQVPVPISRHKMEALAEMLGVSLQTPGASPKILGAVTAVRDHHPALAAKVVMVVVDGAMCSVISSETREPSPLLS